MQNDWKWVTWSVGGAEQVQGESSVFFSPFALGSSGSDFVIARVM